MHNPVYIDGGARNYDTQFTKKLRLVSKTGSYKNSTRHYIRDPLTAHLISLLALQL